MGRLRRLTTQLSNVLSKHSFSTSSIQASLTAVSTVRCGLENLDVNQFRQVAFDPERPLLITARIDSATELCQSSSIPAIDKWFRRNQPRKKENEAEFQYSIHRSYLERFGDTFVPYELLQSQLDPENGGDVIANFRQALKADGLNDLAAYIPYDEHLMRSQESTSSIMAVDGKRPQRFYSFHAPFALFLQATKPETSPGTPHARLPYLYIAQAQIRDLPSPLQEDLPTPNLVLKAGKGDVYDANIWLGTPPTYTPLHKDPNPNLFVQLASSKVVRLFKPEVGLSIFHTVRTKLQGHASSSFRGEEMMEEPERSALEGAVWQDPHVDGGYQAIVKPGDGLFIPKGWWHSIKSLGTDVTASVNWWFR